MPRHAFICWLAILDRLSKKQGSINSALESPILVPSVIMMRRDHLFFSCPFSLQTWLSVSSSIFQTPPTSWELLIKWGEGLKRKSLLNTISKLAWQSCVYNTWKERNFRIHSNQSNAPAVVKDLIIQSVKLRLLSFPSSCLQSMAPQMVFSLGLWLCVGAFLWACCTAAEFLLWQL